MYAAQLDFVGMIYFKFGPDWTDSFLGVADNKIFQPKTKMAT